MEELKRKWEDWYGDFLTDYQWHELEYNGRQVLYVCGTAIINSDGCSLSSDLIQVIGYADSEKPLDEGQRKEITGLLKSQHGIGNISFWSV